MSTKAKAFIEVCGEIRQLDRSVAAFRLREIRRHDVCRLQRGGRGFAREYRSTGRAILVLA